MNVIRNYEYDDKDHVVKIDYPEAAKNIKAVLYEYNNKMRVSRIKAITSSDTMAKTVREYTYSPKGNVSTMKDYTGFDTGSGKYILKTYTYDKFDRVTKMSYANNDNLTTPVEEYSYTYDKNGNILTEDIYNNYIKSKPINELKEYTYDTLGRLTNVKVTDRANNNNISQKSYTYDKVGNRKTESNSDGTKNYYSYNNLNQLSSIFKANDLRITYVYDRNGNIFKEKRGNIEIYYKYDINNQMTEYKKKEDGNVILTENNEYNYNEQRNKKEVIMGNNSKISNYYYSSGSVLYTTDDNSNMLSSNILNLEGNVISSTRNDNNFYMYNKDSRNSTSSIVDKNNNGVVTYKYDEFGEIEQLVNKEFDNEICYTGGIYDKETGEYYLNARHYDPSIARFTTIDTYRGETEEPLSLHLYAYCANNPVNFVDPSGHKFVGFGIQATLSASKSFVNASIGIEIVWFRGRLMSCSPYFYMFGDAGFNSKQKAAKKVYNKVKNKPSKLLKPPFSCSICFFAMFRKKKVKYPSSYEKWFRTYSASFMGYKRYMSKGSGFKVFGAGKNFGGGGVSFSSSYYIRLAGLGDAFYSLKSKVRAKARKMRKKAKGHV